MRNGLIEDVGASVAVPADAVIVDGTGMTVYPGPDRHDEYDGGCGRRGCRAAGGRCGAGRAGRTRPRSGAAPAPTWADGIARNAKRC